MKTTRQRLRRRRRRRSERNRGHIRAKTVTKNNGNFSHARGKDVAFCCGVNIIRCNNAHRYRPGGARSTPCSLAGCSSSCRSPPVWRRGGSRRAYLSPGIAVSLSSVRLARNNGGRKLFRMSRREQRTRRGTRPWACEPATGRRRRRPGAALRSGRSSVPRWWRGWSSEAHGLPW